MDKKTKAIEDFLNKSIIKEEGEPGMHNNTQLDMFANQKEVDKLDRFSFKKEFLSKELLDWVRDAAADGEFQYDHKKDGFTSDTGKNMDIIFNNEKLLIELFMGFYDDVNHDIDMEKKAGDDFEYLLPLKHELKRYLTILKKRATIIASKPH